MIKTKNLTKVYGDNQVISDVNISVPHGKLTALIGPNGAGKSSLLMALGRLLEPTSGEVLLDGQEASTIRHSAYAKKIATQPQSPDISLRLTVEELVSFGRFPYSKGALTEDDHREVDDAISFLSLEPLRATLLDELSGGQRQMAFLAMAIAQQTECLLLDEPLNNLDMKHSVQVMRALRTLCDEKARTVVMVIHDINFAANYSDHIIAMRRGAVQFAGPVDEVISEESLRSLYDLNFEITHTRHVRLCNYFKPTGKFQ
ncbi:iron ABC transporter ATP-binding protein [Comamonas composti]|uniref:iron ABC transporter ATP-binding protein n=1 Tax=Comamonas composti TaxID=408558 RepID=UPI00047883E3|nr:ATP-binding cassette domain-containing protein [Comamonas composti]